MNGESPDTHNNLATILVVDDEPVIRELCEKALNGYRVFQAGTCKDAVSVFENETIDLMLTDVMMPGCTGLDLLRKIKEIDPTTVVIIMTGFVEKEVILGALKEGADDFINKPLNLLQLKTAVEKALAKKVLKEELGEPQKTGSSQEHLSLTDISQTPDADHHDLPVSAGYPAWRV